MQTIYKNGTIITMSSHPAAEAVLTEDGTIKVIGSLQKIQNISSGADIVDLQGCTMLPAFIDPHSHFSSYAGSFLQVCLTDSAGFDEIAERIRQFISRNKIKPGEWVIANGYDHNTLAEKCHPPLALLDACAPDNPLILQHASGHMGVFNSRALSSLGVTASTPSPEGGRIETSGGHLTGRMEENAFFTYMKKAPMPDGRAFLDAYQKAQNSYASYGITSIQEGMTVRQMIPLYRNLIQNDLLYLDLTAYASMPDAQELYDAFPDADGRYDGHLRLGGLKIFLDGSPQGRTAWMRTPYLGQEPAYCGYGTMKDEDVLAALEYAVLHHRQILAHCNGDAAAQQYIDAARIVTESGSDLASLRPVMIHAQLLGTDQLPQIRELGIIPSFFAAHVFHWGDIHIRNFGFERASKISPAASALQNNILFTFHQDTPVIEPNMLETVWCAVNRLTKNGVLLGAGERISVTEALKAVTINAAYQYFDESVKGSIEPGKYADFVILDENPLAVPPGKIRDIRVLKTIKHGNVIFEGD